MRGEIIQAFILTWFPPLLTSICFQRKKKMHQHITMTVKMPYSQNYEVCLAFSDLKNNKVLDLRALARLVPDSSPLGLLLGLHPLVPQSRTPHQPLSLQCHSRDNLQPCPSGVMWILWTVCGPDAARCSQVQGLPGQRWSHPHSCS